MDGSDTELNSNSTHVSASNSSANHRAQLSSTRMDANYVDHVGAPDWLAGINDVPEITQYKEASYDLLQPKPGMTVLDLGCGIGDDARKLLDRVQPGGNVIGVDMNTDMIVRARARHLQNLVQDNTQSFYPSTAARNASDDVLPSEHLRFLVGAAEGLPLPDRSCDAARADRLLQHVSDPLIVLKEMRRVLRPGGRVVLVEPDWRMMAIHPGSVNGGDDDHVFQAIWNWQIAHITHPLMGRQLRARLTQAGFDDVRVVPVSYSSCDFDFVSYLFELVAASEGATKASPALVSLQELESWFAAIRRAEAAQEFIAVLTVFFGFARNRSER